MTSKALPYVTLIGFLFGSTLVVSRFSVEQFHPLNFVSLRLALASLGYLVAFLLTRRPWPWSRRLWGHAIVLGIFMTAIPMSAIVASLQFQSSGITSMLLTTFPAVTVVMAHFILHDEPLTRQTSIGVILAFCGALLLVLLGESGLPDVTQASPVGYFLVFVAILFGSGTTIYSRKYLRDDNTFDVTSIRMFVATGVMVPVTLIWVGFDLSSVDIAGYLALGYAALVGTFIGAMLDFYNIQRFGATASAMAANIIPVVATIGGVIFLGEALTIGMVVSMALIILGVGIVNQKRQTQPEEVSSIAP